MKKLDKVLSVLLIVMVLACVTTTIFASDTILNSLNTTSLDNTTTSKLTNMGSTILSIVTSVGIIITVIVIAILGIKYMMGSMEEKAEYKKSLIPLIIGAILLFGALAIAKLIISFASEVTL